MTSYQPFSKARVFHSPNLLQIAMPMGGLGAGCVCLNGYGGLQDFSIRNKPATSALPDGHHNADSAFAVLHIKGGSPRTKLIEGPLPVEKIYNLGLKAQGLREGGHEGLPRFQSNSFEAEFPFGKVCLADEEIPLDVSITGWNPFIPGDDIASGVPCAILEYTFVNRSNVPVSFEFSYHLSHLGTVGGDAWQGLRDSAIGPVSSGGGGVSFASTNDPASESFGSAALYAVGGSPKIKALWFQGGWFDAISLLWKEISSGAFNENDGNTAYDESTRKGGSVLIEGTLRPSEALTQPIVIAWHFPNPGYSVGNIEPSDCGPDCDCTPPTPGWSPFYAGQWADAKAVALYAAENYSSLRQRTQGFADALYSSTLPSEVLDAVGSNLTILKSPTLLRQKNGNLWGWEGCFAEKGCCNGSCTHVWNYAQALPHLFPKLERTLREQELLLSMDSSGHVNFRSALPDGPTSHDYHAASDGQLGGILKLYRDYHISGNTEWLARLYPHAKRSLDYCIKLWDPDQKGLLYEPHHNTYDIEFWGADGMCSSVYIGALCALSNLAEALGKGTEAGEYRDLAASGARLMSETLFNGEYFEQNVEWRNARNSSLRDRLTSADPAQSDANALLEAEGPKYQYGVGCLADGVIGSWMASIYGVETPIDREQIRSTLASIFRYNFKSDLFDHASTQRPGYAFGHEGGLLLCTWPRGGRQGLPFPYSDEVWTGIEYQVASHMIQEGMVDEALTIVRTVRSRYEGHVRNPFNEYECGSYYARALASYALIGSLSGFRYSAADKTLYFGPKHYDKQKHYRCFFSAESAFGWIETDWKSLTVNVVEGTLVVKRFELELDGNRHSIERDVIAVAGTPSKIEFEW